MTSRAVHPRPDAPGLVEVLVWVAYDEDGRAPAPHWPPPVDSEVLWATPLGEQRYRIENTPWFAENLGTHDVVIAVEYEGVRRVMQKAEWAGHLTVCVACDDPGAVLATFADLGVGGESAGADFGIAALDIPPGTDLRAVRERLRAGGWDYQEAAVSAEWREL